MPINYKLYHPDWKKVIRPDILARAGHKCEECGIENHNTVLRGEYGGVDCYQDMDGWIYDAATSERIGGDYLGEVHPTNKFITIVLTIAHLDHDIENNDYSNLKALCQRCHLRYDAKSKGQKRRIVKNQLNLNL